MSKRAVRIAAFDIDGTVFRSSLLLELVEELIAEGIFPASTRATYKRELLRWLDRKGDYEVYVQKVISVFARQIKGVKFSTGQKAAGKIISEKRNRVYRYTRDLISQLKKRDYFLVAVSHSPKFIVGPFGRKLGFDKVYGSIYAVNARGRFTGKVDYEDMISDKAAILKFAMKKFSAPFKGSIGVGDTESDIPMLSLVEKPIAFNPNRKLYRYAKKRGWKIVVERKDVIYEQ
ncbi:MAG: HAD-IB family hydrolase [bacterium]|nr:HAD-IB family hydrolase [bacterium]